MGTQCAPMHGRPDGGNSVIEVYFDGHCPLCRREMQRLRRLDRQRRILFTDVAASDFDASTVGVPMPTLMERVHARSSDGKLVHGMEAFRHLYAAVGLGPLAYLTRLPGIRQIADRAYRWIARNRMRLTARSKVSSDRHCG